MNRNRMNEFTKIQRHGEEGRDQTIVRINDNDICIVVFMRSDTRHLFKNVCIKVNDIINDIILGKDSSKHPYKSK